MVSPPKNDAWEPYSADQQRIVFIRRQGRLKPYLGYVVQWPASGMGGRFQVAYMDEAVSRTFRIEWFEAPPAGADRDRLQLGIAPTVRPPPRKLGRGVAHLCPD